MRKDFGEVPILEWHQLLSLLYFRVIMVLMFYLDYYAFFFFFGLNA